MFSNIRNPGGGPVPADTSAYAYDRVADIRALHRMLPGYTETPLRSLPGTAAELGIRGLYVKDESSRFGLKAFKGLGGSYAMFRILCRELGLDPTAATLQDIRTNPKTAEQIFVTTTDGNHGKGVSWAAGVFGCPSYVFMPRGTVSARAEAVRQAGTAEVTVTDLCYDDCVRMTSRLAEENGWHLIQDTSWPGYTEVPEWIMLGYTTMVYEALSQMPVPPTHVLVQAGVGSLAGTVCAVLHEAFGDAIPRISIVEADAAACIYETMAADDGQLHTASGSGITMMAGLNCGTPCSLAWNLIHSYAFSCMEIGDDDCAMGMRSLAHPLADDPAIVAGESGASGFAAALQAAFRPDDVVLVFNTEGDTDPENYRTICS